MSAVVAIPARMQSTRFPGKVLADINGKPMLWHVFQGASQALRVSDVWIITDSQKVFDQAPSWGAKALMTEEHWPSGTARIASVSQGQSAKAAAVPSSMADADGPLTMAFSHESGSSTGSSRVR